CEFTRFVAVSSGALDRDEFLRYFREWKVRKFRHLALNDDYSGLALQRLHSQQDRHSASACRTVQHNVHAAAARDFHDSRQWIFSLNIDHVIRTQRLCDIETR